MENQDNNKKLELGDELKELMSSPEVKDAKGLIGEDKEGVLHIDQLQRYCQKWAEEHKLVYLNERSFVVSGMDNPVGMGYIANMCYLDAQRVYETQLRGGETIFPNAPKLNAITSIFKSFVPLLKKADKGSTTFDIWLETMGYSPRVDGGCVWVRDVMVYQAFNNFLTYNCMQYTKGKTTFVKELFKRGFKAEKRNRGRDTFIYFPPLSGSQETRVSEINVEKMTTWAGNGFTFPHKFDRHRWNKKHGL